MSILLKLAITGLISIAVLILSRRMKARALRAATEAATGRRRAPTTSMRPCPHCGDRVSVDSACAKCLNTPPTL